MLIIKGKINMPARGLSAIDFEIRITISCRIVLMVADSNMALFIVRCVSVLIGFTWAVYAAMQFLGDCQPPKRKALAAYPMALFYFVISWLVISHN